MYIEKQKYPFLRQTKCAAMSKNFLVFSTGQRIIICNRHFDILHEIENLKYAYHVYISPDESRLLAISSSNLFYLIDLKTFDVVSTRIKPPYNANLEGRGCWMEDSQSFLIVCENLHTFRSAIRKYQANDVSLYETVLPEEYWITSILYVKEKHSYLIVGMDRLKAMTDQPDAWFLMWYNGLSFEKYPFSGNPGEIFEIDYDKKENVIRARGNFQYYTFNDRGEMLPEFQFSEDNNLEINGTAFPIKEKINIICSIPNTDMCAVGTSNAFYVYGKNQSLIGKIRESYGVQEINVISEDTVIYATWSGIRVIKIRLGTDKTS